MAQQPLAWLRANFHKRWVRAFLYFAPFLVLVTPFFLPGAIGFVGAMPLIFLLFLLGFNLVPFWRSDDLRAGGLHLLVLVITVLSFYAFGWPRNLDELPEKFSKLCVILVLFVLSELAVQLTLHAGKVEGKIKATGDDAVEAIRLASTQMTEATQSASREIQTTLAPVAGVQKRLEELAPRIDSAVNTATGSVAVLGAVNQCGDSLFAEALLQQLDVYARSWALRIKEIKDDAADPLGTERVRLWTTVLKTYIQEEIKDIDGQEIRMRDLEGRWERGAVLPVLATNEDMYLRLLEALANAVIRIETKGVRRPLFRAITNILPSQWYNWPLADRRACQYEYINEYRLTAARIRQSAQVDFKRMVVVFQDHQFNGGGNKALVRARTGVRFASELRADCQEKFYLYISARPDGGQLSPGGIYPAEELNSILGDNIFDTNALKPEDRVYPIISTTHAAILDGISADTGTRYGRYYIRKERLLDFYISNMHTNEDDAVVGVLTRQEEIEMLPDGAPDMLMVGFSEEDGAESWVMAVCSTLRVGERTMLMYIISDPAILTHIGDWWEQLKTREEVRSLRQFVGEVELEIDQDRPLASAAVSEDDAPGS